MVNILEHSSISNDDFKQLRTRIWIDYDNQYWVEHHVGHHRYECHKLNGPTTIYDNGAKSWLINDIYHNYDKPAIIWSNGLRRWYIDGKHIRSFQYE